MSGGSTRGGARRPLRPVARLRAAHRVGVRGWTRRYARLPIARKLALFPRLTATSLGLVLLVTVSLGRLGEQHLARLADTFYPRVERTWRLEQTLAALQRTLQDAAGTGDADFLVRADSLAAAFAATARMDEQSAPHGDAAAAAQAQGHAQIGRMFAEYYAAGRALTVRMRSGEVGDDVAGAMAAFHARHAALRRALDADALADRGAVVRAFDAARAGQRVAWTASLGITLAFVVAVMGLARLATRLVTVPLGQAVRAADRVADGDLDVRLPEAGPDEVGQLLTSMGRMVGNLRRSEEQLSHQAYHDALTGLPNRAHFRKRLARAAAEPGGRAALAVLYIDLDDFKGVNDALGHAAGDALLGEMAGRLLRATRGCDTVARLGGDEFAVLLREVGGAGDAVVVAERVARALAAPFGVHGVELRVGASVGIALGADAAVADRDGDGEDLLRFADVAMYAAKHGGKGRHAVFEPAMHLRAQERRALEHDLREAVARGELVLHYQPIVRLDTGRVTGAEALVRWQHPGRGLVPPGEFIPLAESTGMIVEIGRWVLEEACREAARWRAAAGDGAPTVAVNVSAAQIQHPGLLDEVRGALGAAGLPARALTVEITETAMLADTEAAVARLHELKAVGVMLAVDDFGTGYSSLSYLQRFPVDVLKIDKSFVDRVAADGRDPVLTRAIAALGGALGLRVVAEGVERAAQPGALRALGCGYGQGYHYARPLPAAEFAALLAGRAPSFRLTPPP